MLLMPKGVCRKVCLYIHMHRIMYLSVAVFIYPSQYLYIRRSIYISIAVFIYLLQCLYIRRSVYISVAVFICQSQYLFICPSQCSYICRSIYIPYAQKFPWYVNFADFMVTYGYSENLIHENLLVCNN